MCEATSMPGKPSAVGGGEGVSTRGARVVPPHSCHQQPPRGHHSLVLLNVGHNSGHSDKGPRRVGQGSRQPLQQHLGGGGGRRRW